MKVKELDKTVNVAWSPPAQHPILLAAGTAAQQLDASFSTSASLELHALNLSEPGLDMQLKVSAPSEQRFHKVVWGSNGAIVGGCDGGLVQIYNSSKLLSGEKTPIAKQGKHSGSVRALDFNPFQSNLLATGAAESEIYIWDLNNINTPMTPGAKSQPLEDVAWISWNRQVQHILASSFAQRCVVWDLRKNEPIIKLSDSQSRIRWKVVSWHPDIATQLCLASEEDSAPVIQLWDLRFATSPIRSLEHHQRGVLSIAWCMQDPDLLLSCGKDNRILCWNPNSNVPGGEVVCEVATTTQWNFDVAWCPRNPALMSSCSFDGHVSIYSLTGGTQANVQTSNKIADSFPGMDYYAQATPPQPAPVSVDLRKPPKWLRRPCGVSFGFGGKLVMFEFDHSAPTQQPANLQQPGFVAAPAVRRTVSVSQVVTETSLISRAQALDLALQQGDYLEFCKSRSSASSSEHERFLWECLCANFEPNPSTEVLSLLGFAPEKLNCKLDNHVTDSPLADGGSRSIDGLSDKLHTLSTVADDDAFSAIAAAASYDKRVEPAAPFQIIAGDGPDGMLCQALLLGQTETAVDLCLKEERYADAIILAMTGGPDLLARTQYAYFQKSKGYLSTLMEAVVTEDWSHVITSCDLDSWKEALVAALTHTRGDDFSRLCEQLGYRLEVEAGGIHRQNAQLCYAISGNLHKLVENWMSSVRPSTPQQIQDLVEMVAVLRTAVELKGHNVDISGLLADTLTQYAEFLASQGSLSSALAYLSHSQDEKMSDLRERLTVALGIKPLRSQVVQDPRRTSIQNQRVGSVGSTGRQAPYYYNQTQQVQQTFQPVSTFSTPSYNPIPPVPVQPVPPIQQLTGVPPLQTQASVAGLPPVPSQSPGLPRAPSASGSTSNRKYVVDPSVQTGPAGFLQPFNQPSNSSLGQPPMFSTPGYNSPPDFYNTSSIPQPSNPISAPLPSVPMNQPPPGWNDPPAVKKAPRPAPQKDVNPVAPITHPLFGAVPQELGPPVQNMNGSYIDPLGNNNLTGQSGGYMSQQPSLYQPPNVYQPSNMYQPPNVFQPPSVHQQPPVVQSQMIQPTDQISQSTHPSRLKPEPPPPKAPIPEEHAVLQTVFDDLRNRCAQAANNPQSKRKLEDVSKKLEVLYDALRDQRLSPSTLQSLHELMQMVRAGDYGNGLLLHTQLVSGPDFSQISSFMPGLKVLLQSALQLGVYLQ